MSTHLDHMSNRELRLRAAEIAEELLSRGGLGGYELTHWRIIRDLCLHKRDTWHSKGTWRDKTVSRDAKDSG